MNFTTRMSRLLTTQSKLCKTPGGFFARVVFVSETSRWFLLACLLWVVAAALPAHAAEGAANDYNYIMQTQPWPVYQPLAPEHYNLKWGNMIARFDAGTQVELNDNIALSDQQREADISIMPGLGMGFLYPFTKENVMQLDVGIGYRWYLAHPKLNTWDLSSTMTPHTRVNMLVLAGDFQFNFYDRVSLQTDPTTMAQLNGQNKAQLEMFRQLQNNCGVLAEWRPVRQIGMSASYDFGITRSINAHFTSLDMDAHTFAAGAYYMPSTKLGMGFNGSYTLEYYMEHIQNNGRIWTLGPFVTWEMSDFVTLEAAAGYTEGTYQLTGSILDSSNFSGITYQGSLRHRINRLMTQTLRGGHSLGLGYGSNFTEIWTAQHTLVWQIAAAVNLTQTVSWNGFKGSGNVLSDSGYQLLYYLGTGFQLTRQWSANVAYSFAYKNSDYAGQDYAQNRLVLDFRRKF